MSRRDVLPAHRGSWRCVGLVRRRLAALLQRSWLGPLEVVFLLAPLVHVPLGFSVVHCQVGEFTPLGRSAHLLRFAAIVPQMARFHGTIIAIGFGVSALVGWRLALGRR